MKKALYTFTLAGLVGLASCSTPAEEGRDTTEVREDQAQETAEDMEDAAEDADTSAIIE